LIGVPSTMNAAISRATGSLATVIRHLTDRARAIGLEPVAPRRRALVDPGGRQVADRLLRFVLPPDGRGHRFVAGRPHPEALAVGHRSRGEPLAAMGPRTKASGAFHHPALRSRSWRARPAAGSWTVHGRFMDKAQRG
jgi:hypothetical protein